MQFDPAICYQALRQRDSRFDGKFFTAVKTTGIYCRPICPAKTPQFDNVIFYPSAAAAQEAGFRPCLRCRPETAPGIGAWRGTGNSVSRALALIESGALDESNVDALAARVGLGERQLRRLFRQHMGASVVTVAQTRRILLAKQLIHETHLPMAEIAFAAGFGSIRRFNEIFQTLYGRSPRELKRENREEIPMAHGGIRLSLPYHPPYDWPFMLDFFRRRAIAGIEYVGDNHYMRSFAIDGEQGMISVEPGKGNSLSVLIDFPKISALPLIISKCKRLFDLNADPSAISAHLSRDPILAPLILARPGMRIPGAWDGFEIAVRAILGQQITVSAAVKLAGKLVMHYGEKLAEPKQRLTHLFPSAETVAEAKDIATLGIVANRAATLSAVAEKAHADEHFFEIASEFHNPSSPLRAISGIGEWTAHYVALRLDYPDAFPASDVGLLRSMTLLEGKKYSISELTERASSWKPWRGYAAQHLWANLN